MSPKSQLLTIARSGSRPPEGGIPTEELSSVIWTTSLGSAAVMGTGFTGAVNVIGMGSVQSVTVTGLETETSLYTLIMQYTRDFTTLAQELQKLRDEIQNLREELSRRPLVSTVNLYDLGTDTLRIKFPISVVLHETEEESVARWPETRAYGIGGTLSEGIADLKQNIATLFFDLSSRPIDSLGEIALDTLRTLKMHLEAGQ